MEKINNHINKKINNCKNCLAGDTKIKLPLKKLTKLEDLTGTGSIWVKSVNNYGKRVIGKGISVQQTGAEARLYKVTFDDNSFIRCTLNHMFLLPNLSYKELSELQTGDVLYKRSIKAIEEDTVEAVYNVEVENHHNFEVFNGVIVKGL